MYNNNETKTMMQIRKDFVFRMSNFELNKGQFTIVEDMPITKPIRTEKKEAKTGKQYTVYKIKISADGFEGDLEMFGGELNRIAIIMPASLSNYKGVTLAYDGTRWVYICCDANPQVPGAVQQKPELRSPLDQKDQYMEQLVQAMKANDITNKGCSLSDVMNYCKNITNSDALELIMYAKGKGAIYEMGGLYKAA